MEETEALRTFYKAIVNFVLTMLWLALLLIDMDEFVKVSMAAILVMLPLYLADKLFVQKL